MSLLDLFFISSFIFVIFLVGIRKVSQTEASYLVADRRTGFFALTATLVMTEINTGTLVGFASLGYLSGFRGLVLPLVFLFGLLFYAFSVAKKWKAFNGLSVAEFFKERYGSDVGLFASLIFFGASSCFSAAYIKSLVVIFQPFFPGVSDWITSGAFVLIAFLLSIRGGILSVIYTDVVSFLVTFVFFPIMAFFSWRTSDIKAISWETLAESSESLSIPYVISLILLTMFTYILSPGSGQKVFTARSERVAFLSMIVSAGIVYFLYTCAVLSASFLKARGIILTNPEHALSFALNYYLPKGLLGLGYGVFFAASATTLIGLWSAMTSMVIGDFFGGKFAKGPSRSMIITAIITLVSYLTSNLFIDKVLNKMILANIPIAGLSFALLAGFYWEKASRGGAYFSIISGFICGIGSYIYFGESGSYTVYWAIFGIPIIFLSGILGSYLLPQEKKKAKIILKLAK